MITFIYVLTDHHNTSTTIQTTIITSIHHHPPHLVNNPPCIEVKVTGREKHLPLLLRQIKRYASVEWDSYSRYDIIVRASLDSKLSLHGENVVDDGDQVRERGGVSYALTEGPFSDFSSYLRPKFRSKE